MKANLLVMAFLLFAGSRTAFPDDLDSAYENLKQAESRKDAVQVKKLAAETCALARQAISTSVPEGVEQEAWNKRIAYARDIELYTEYALYATAVQGPPATTVELLAALEQQNPKSKFLDQAYGNYVMALNQLSDAQRAVTLAETALAQFPDNEDLLLVLCDSALNKKQTDRAQAYSERLIVVLYRHPVPEGMPPADWERKKSTALGRAHWTAGMMHGDKNQYFEADKDLRAALRLVKGNDTMTAAALFYLGVANYQLGAMSRNRPQILEGASFSEQAAAIKGPLSPQAWRNAQAMKTEAEKLRLARR